MTAIQGNNTGILRINQSKIKRLTKPTLCPLKYKREEITLEDKRPTTEAMLKGQYAEYKLTGGLPKEGGIPVLPLLKNGKMSTDQIRIDAAVQNCRQVLEKYGITFHKAGETFEVPVGDVIFHGTMDNLASWKLKPNKPYIADIKFPKDCTSTWGDFCWGRFDEKHPDVIQMEVDEKDGVYIARFDKEKIEEGEAMDILQAFAYMYIMEKKTLREWGFIYIIFDYKPKQNWKIVEIVRSQEGIDDVERRLLDTRHKLTRFEQLGYPAIPTWNECKSCKFLECPDRLKPEEEKSAAIEPQKTNDPFAEEDSPF